MKTKRILLTTDFSTHARLAIDYAIHLFDQVACTFYMLHAYEIGPSGLSSTMGKARDTRLFRVLKEESESNMKRLSTDLEAKHRKPLHTFEFLCIPDSLINAVGKTVLDKSVHYIFMGTKGSSALKEVFMGSNTVKVIQHIDYCPIMAVPALHSHQSPDKIAFATNFEREYSKVALAPLVEMAKICGTGIEIVHVDTGEELTEKQKASKELLTEVFKGTDMNFIKVKKHSNISKTIMSYTAEHKNIGIVAMVHNWHNFLKKLLNENVIKRMTFHTDIPFLVLPRSH